MSFDRGEDDRGLRTPPSRRRSAPSPSRSSIGGATTDSLHSSPSKQSLRSDGDSVHVATIVRPLIEREIQSGCSTSLAIEGDSVATKSGHQFTFDAVIPGTEEALEDVYAEQIVDMIGGLFDGYNASVLAYGQTGSGKTYTMGMGGTHPGIAHKTFRTLFDKVEEASASSEISVKTSFIEIYKDDIRDLLEEDGHVGTSSVVIREHARGAGVFLSGARLVDVMDGNECLDILNRGIGRRATAESSMNVRSSRSHAIFTIYVERKVEGEKARMAKLHLVDLAGSERVALNEIRGQRFKEGVQINMGLLALSNCIAALTDVHRRDWGHVPYRDSKLTRLLQDSLGGNSRTVMLACVSPADSNSDETLNTLKYANRARGIRNRVSINFEKSTDMEIKLKRQLDAAQERISQLEMLVNVLHAENVALKESGVNLSSLTITPGVETRTSPRTPAATPGLTNTPLSELLLSCKRARQRAEILLSTKSPMSTPRSSFDARTTDY